MYLYWLTKLLPFWWGVGTVYIAAIVFDWGLVLALAAWEHGFSWSKHPCTKWGVPLFMPLIPAAEMACLYHIRHLQSVWAGLPWNVGILIISLGISILMERATFNKNGVWYWYQRWHSFIFAALLACILAATPIALLADNALGWQFLGIVGSAIYGSLWGWEGWLNYKNKLPPFEYMPRQKVSTPASSD